MATTSAQLKSVSQTTSASQNLFSEFWEMSPAKRDEKIIEAIKASHTWHFERNPAYQRSTLSRGIGQKVTADDFPLLLRPTAQTFKSYIDVTGSPFPGDLPQAFLNWLANQLSIELPRERFAQFKTRYGSAEALLQDFERIYADYGLEVSTSSGTSGRATIMLRDQSGMDTTVESFYLCFQRYFGMRADHRAVFIMPRQTRIAMVSMAAFSILRVGLDAERVHYTIPFPAEPDQVRIRSGLTFRPGWRGQIEQKLWHPFMNWANETYVMPRAVRETLNILEAAQTAAEKVLVFGSWIQLHAIALLLHERRQVLELAPGSLFGSGGGFKEQYPFNLSQIQEAIRQVVRISDGSPLPMRDVYGMAEANWAAMQCRLGNYHIPPWVHAVTLDENDEFQEKVDATGLLAFFDPLGGGQLFPAFFKTADRVRLINGAGQYDPAYDCACGETWAYITQNSIQRVDLLNEAGCAAQI